MVLGMKDHSIIIKVRQGEFTWPYSLLINVSHVYYISPDSSKKIKDVLAEFNEGGSLKQYDPHEVRTFPFQDFLKPYVPAFPYSPLISLAQLGKLASPHFFLLNFKWAIAATQNYVPQVHLPSHCPRSLHHTFSPPQISHCSSLPHSQTPAVFSTSLRK